MDIPQTCSPEVLLAEAAEVEEKTRELRAAEEQFSQVFEREYLALPELDSRYRSVQAHENAITKESDLWNEIIGMRAFLDSKLLKCKLVEAASHVGVMMAQTEAVSTS